MGTPVGIGRRKATFRRAVTPHVPRPITDQAMTSSRIVHTMPPCATRVPALESSGARVSSVHDPSGSRVELEMQAVLVELAAREAVMRLEVERAVPVAKAGRPRHDSVAAGVATASDVQVADLAGLGLDELLARRDLLAHELS